MRMDVYDEVMRTPTAPGTDAYDRLHATLTPKRLLDDVRQTSPSVQTFSVESFHSLINRFAPKSYAFSHQGMFIRCALAALHYNENADTEQAVSKGWELRWKIRHPKAKKGEPVITSVKAEPSFGFPVFSTDTVTCIEQENDHRQLRGASHRKTIVASCCFWTGACARNNTENDGDVPAQRLHKDSRRPVASWAWRKCCHED
ncbi:hypothetical protein MTO96_016915 [Rhipicephalus appendiculatus]